MSQDSSSTAPQPARSKPQDAKLWEEFGSQQANAIPGAGTPSKAPRPSSSSDNRPPSLIPKQSLDGYKNMVQTPCARDSFLVGIGGGAAVGGIKAVIGGLRKMWPACNWAVGSFTVLTIATYELCQRQRRIEMEGMKEATELMAKLKAKKEKEKADLKAAAEEAQRYTEEQRWKNSWRNPRNWLPW
ncbi:hypothetical protein KEM56_002220 [Ascosphaera pollenicola]|nr:hypothetical protein KEM56_002220 [Ascosphaera pollenicola]